MIYQGEGELLSLAHGIEQSGESDVNTPQIDVIQKCSKTSFGPLDVTGSRIIAISGHSRPKWYHPFGGRYRPVPPGTMVPYRSGSHPGHFVFYRIKKFVFKKKLELIEGRYLASIWKCFVQRSIEESMKIATPG